MNSEIISLDNVNKFEVLTSYTTFVVRSDAANSLSDVNNAVSKVCDDFDTLVTRLNGLKEVMGKNDDLTDEIDSTIKALNEKKQDLITKNGELFQSIDAVISYVYQNKNDKASSAANIATAISKIQIYQG